MRFKGIKLGLSKGKDEKNKAEEAQKVEKEGRSEENPKASVRESQRPAELSKDEEISVKPHGPLQELSLDSAGELDDVELEKELGGDSLTGEELEAVKVVEIEPDTDELPVEGSTGLGTDVLPQEEEPKKEEPKPADDSFDSLFANDEEEENPLASLIESLPDVSAQEIINDINELKDIMREGH